MERLDHEDVKFTDYDDVRHLIHDDCKNLDLVKMDRWARAAYNVDFNKLNLRGKDSFINKLEDWQV